MNEQEAAIGMLTDAERSVEAARLLLQADDNYRDTLPRLDKISDDLQHAKRAIWEGEAAF